MIPVDTINVQRHMSHYFNTLLRAWHPLHGSTGGSICSRSYSIGSKWVSETEQQLFPLNISTCCCFCGNTTLTSLSLFSQTHDINICMSLFSKTHDINILTSLFSNIHDINIYMTLYSQTHDINIYMTLFSQTCDINIYMMLFSQTRDVNIYTSLFSQTSDINFYMSLFSKTHDINIYMSLFCQTHDINIYVTVQSDMRHKDLCHCLTVKMTNIYVSLFH